MRQSPSIRGLSSAPVSRKYAIGEIALFDHHRKKAFCCVGLIYNFSTVLSAQLMLHQKHKVRYILIQQFKYEHSNINRKFWKITHISISVCRFFWAAASLELFQTDEFRRYMLWHSSSVIRFRLFLVQNYNFRYIEWRR